MFVKKPERIFAMESHRGPVLARLSPAPDHRLRTQLAARGKTVPNQQSSPTNRPTIRWLFQCSLGHQPAAVCRPCLLVWADAVSRYRADSVPG
ncbi:MAG: hypothetical protein C5B60_10725 [Chloroflexi bacterium]|nr:MAG: hypothetical protein C5B60_10725 [Chloroflexota bacterium]